MFLLNQKIIISPICQYFWHHILFAAELEEPKIGMWSKGLKGKSQPLVHFIWSKAITFNINPLPHNPVF